MKIIVLNGSARNGGNTAGIISLIEKRLRKKAAAADVAFEWEYIPLVDQNIAFCRGCRVCFDKGERKCPLKDNLTELNHKLLEADGIVMASPVYVGDVSGIVKNFIDRMAFHCHRPAFAGKASVVIVTSGIGPSGHALRTMQFALMSWGFRTERRKIFRMGALMDTTEAIKKYGTEAVKFADILFASVMRREPVNPSFYSLVTFRVQQEYWRRTMPDKDTYDYKYWKSNGWLESGCNYYISHKSNPIKIGTARLVGRLIASFTARK
jgi:multimeric flavodoxin WrbA